MKRFMLFSGEEYNSRGGMNDFKGSFDTLEDAINKGSYLRSKPKGRGSEDWFHVYDTIEKRIVHTVGCVYS